MSSTAAEALATVRHTCVRGHGTVHVNGVRLDPLAPSDLPGRIDSFVRCGLSHVVHFLPAHPTVIARRDTGYRDVLNRGDLNLVDGASVAVAARLYGQRTARTTGSDALAILPREGVEAGFRHYLYGGTSELLGRLSARIETDCPGVAIAGLEAPPFRDPTPEELGDTAARVREADADLLWIGVGTPGQDIIADRLRSLGAAPVILCVGAAFDFISGTKKRAPGWVQAIGMEWAFRLASEPRRLWRRYLIGNAQFLAGVISDRLRLGDPH